MHFFQKYLAAVLCTAFFTADAQDVPRIRNFTPDDYGNQNQNWALGQSPEGWIYAGNNGGLLEFDGARWQKFSMPEHQTVRAVAIGRNGEIFCGGFAEFGFWSTDAAGRFVYTSLSSRINAAQLDKEEIWHILALPDYVLFQSFSTIYKFDYQEISILNPPSSIMFAREVNGQVFVPVIDRGVYELLPDNTFRFIESTEILSDKIVQFLVPDGAGGVWVGTTNHGIFILKNGKCHPWDNPLNTEFRKYQLNKALVLRSTGGWVIGTILNGAYVLDPPGQLRFHLHRENGLQNNTVLALHEDSAGNLWLGLDRGIDFVALRSPLTLFTDQSGKIGTVYTAAEYQEKLYIGTNQGVFFRPRPGADFQLVESTQGQVWQLQVFDNQLICGHNSGTFTVSNGKARKISEVTGGWCTVKVPAKENTLLQSTYTGLVVFRKNKSGKWQFEQRVGGFNRPLKRIAFDAKGYLWGVHPNRGLLRLRLNESLSQVNEFKVFTREDGLPTEFYLDLAPVGNQIYVNTPPAPLRIDIDNEVVFFPDTGPEYARLKILPGYGNERFLADSSGIRLLRAAEVHYFPLSLVPAYENIVALSEAKYLFCLENGFAILDKRELPSPERPDVPAASIRSVETVSGEFFLPKAGLKFGWQDNSLKFHFTTPFFERSPKFSWRLEGFSTAWSPWQNNPEKEFTNLQEGKYVFRIRADTGGKEARLEFRVEPPWYRSNRALFLYGALLVMLFFGVEKINRIRLDRQRRHLEAENLRELSRQRAEAEREKLMLEVENKNRELSNAALNLIRKNEVLQRLKDEIIDSKSNPHALQKIVRLIDGHLEGDHDWQIFEESFNRVHDDFFKRLMHDFPDLTPGDLRLAAYLKMNLASKEIAPMLNISVRGVENKRYRLRKKLELPEDANLTEFIMNF